MIWLGKSECLGNLGSGIGKYETLSLNNMCSIFMDIIFNPFKINSFFHCIWMVLFNMNCDSKTFALCAIATTLLTHGRGSQRY